MWLCTPPSDTSPHRCSAELCVLQFSAAARNASLPKKSPSAMDFEMRVSSWYTTRPAPMLVWPTSLLPIWPSGRPTSMPEAPINVIGLSFIRRSRFGVDAAATALP
ncbi:MAG: hypothetical protein BWY37_02112 [Firmicutes bacterium ADurb.Bin262]|nr:MAG: hypothetical protein BWY37_02112 [Firmicutes bacterium ADurb.Bin262]